MLKIKFLGGTREIGRSAIALKAEGLCCLLDYGILLNEEPGFPFHVPPKDVDFIVITHAHLDHSGAVPVFFLRRRIPVYGTDLTFDLFKLLMVDFLHLTGYYLPFEYLELDNALSCARCLPYGKSKTIGGRLQLTLLNAGHIPGSAQVLLRSSEAALLYTGDFNLTETRLIEASASVEEPVDVLIMESTYADRDHPERLQLEREFVNALIEVVERGGVALVPAFSVGRSQEILCILRAQRFPYEVAIDGMARQVNRILEAHPQFLRNPRFVLRALRQAIWIRGRRDRRRIFERAKVVVSPAGMLKGGPASFYLKRLAHSEKNAIFLVGYQVPGTPGRELLERKRLVINGEICEVKAEVRYFDFSSHCGRSQLLDFLKRVRGNPTIYTLHGAEGNCELLAQLVREELGLEAKAPEPGEVVRI